MTGPVETAAHGRTARRTTVGLGTFISIDAQIPPGAVGGELLDQVCAEFERVEALMHPTREGSDLLAIAHASPGECVRIHAPTFAVLELCVQLCHDSDGLFDPCTPDRPGRLDDLVLEAPDCVRSRGRGVAIDLGGIAKGFAIDRGISVLREAGCTSALINVGGDARVFGGAPQPFNLHVAGRLVATIELKDEAIALSEPRSTRSPSGHRGFYSPRTRAPVTGHAVAIRAPTATIADALTKCAILAPPELFARLMQSYDAHRIALPNDQ